MKYYYFLAGITLLTVIYFSVLSARSKKRNINRTMDYQAHGTNIALGITKGKNLYKQLISQVHPDRVEPGRRVQANELVQRINAARYDYAALLNLQEEVNAFIETTQQ